MRQTVSASPHITSNNSTRKIMTDVLIALVPCIVCATVFYGYHVIINLVTCLIFCFVTELLYSLIKSKNRNKDGVKSSSVKDLSFAVTAVILALNLPSVMTVSAWNITAYNAKGGVAFSFDTVVLCALGSIVSIALVKMLFGGLGQNFMNPALGGRCFLMLSFSSIMTSFTVEKGANWLYGISVDATSAATPLMQVKQGELPKLTDMFLGTTTGSIGETSVAALLTGAAYLLVRRVIDWKIPVIYIASFAVFDVILMIAPPSFSR